MVLWFDQVHPTGHYLLWFSCSWNQMLARALVLWRFNWTGYPRWLLRWHAVRAGHHLVAHPEMLPRVLTHVLSKWLRIWSRHISWIPRNPASKLGPSIDETPWGHLLNFSSFSVALTLKICELNSKVIHCHSSGDNHRTTVTDSSIQKRWSTGGHSSSRSIATLKSDQAVVTSSLIRVQSCFLRVVLSGSGTHATL